MKKSIVNFLLLSLVITVFCPSAFAWNDVGHKLTAYIAWQRMSPAARENVIKILLKAPEDSDLSALYPQDSRSAAARQRELFMIAAYWADIVRDNKFPMRYKYNRGNWHYSDTFWMQDENGKAKILENPNEEGGKAVEQLFEAEKTMRNLSANDSEKAIAIAWFLHLSGDIHQPLHTSARITKTEPKGDQGGNTFLLTPKNTPRENQMNLHWFWDSIVNRVITRKNDAADSTFLPPIAEQMMKKYPFAKAQSRLNLGKFDEWQKEVFAIATKEVFPSTLVREQMPSKQYVSNTFRISEEQITLAGYRMGETLNAIFGKQTAQQNQSDERREIEQTGSIIGQGKDDVKLWFAARTVLFKTEGLRDSTISHDVVDNVITLRGTVPNKAQKNQAQQAVKRIAGVKAVKNLLKIFKSKNLRQISN